MSTVTQKATWWIFAFFCIVIGLYPALYFLLDANFGLLQSKSTEVLTSTLWNGAFYTHIIFGGVALLIGWVQFNRTFRDKNLRLHKKIGMAYVTAVFFSGIAAVHIGLFATGGLVSKSGFISLGIVWLFTTAMGWITAKKQDFDAHENWMTFSYAACFAAVTLRLWLPLLIYLHQGEFVPAYRIVAWLCWVPNILVAFWIVNRRK